MYSRQQRTSKNPASEPATTSQFARKPFTVQPQPEASIPEQTPDAQTQQEQAKLTQSNWPDVSMFTYRPPTTPPPRVQMKRKVGESGEQILEKAPKPPKKVQEIKKAIAAKNAKQVLTILAGASESEFTLLVQSFTAANTRWFLENQPKANTVANQAQIIQRFKGERSAQGALALEGKLYWAGSSGADPNDNYQIRTTTKRYTTDRKGIEQNINEFAVWIKGGKEPTDASKMNCWEAILYSAYRAGVVTKKWLVDIHQEAAQKGSSMADETSKEGAALLDTTIPIKAGVNEYNEVLRKYLGYNNSQPLTPKNKPKRGDIVFLNGLGHVVISLGTNSQGLNEVMSLWIYPVDKDTRNFINTFQKTTLEKIQQDWAIDNNPAFQIRFAPNPF